jgi:uncharacterized membrane protein YjjP (DUF1212 family)
LALVAAAPTPQAAGLDHLIVDAGRFLLRNSAEGTFDLAENLRSIGDAYGASVETLVTMEGLVVVIDHPDAKQTTAVIHAQPSLERLDQLRRFKALHTRILAGGLSVTEAQDAMTAIETSPDPYRWPVRFVGVLLLTVGFAPSMQATWKELIDALILGLVMAAIFVIGETQRSLSTMLPLVGAIGVSVVGFSVLNISHAPGGPVLVMIPALFVMIPGDFLCASAAEIAVGHFSVGTIRLVQSLFILLQLAAGVLIGAAVCGVPTTRLIATSTINDLPWIIIIVAWIPFALGVVFTFSADMADIGWIIAFVYVAWGVQLGIGWVAGETVGTFVAAVVLSFGGRLLSAPDHRPPGLVMIIGGVFVLTVGSVALRGITTLAGGDHVKSFHDMASFAKIAGALTFGLIVGTAAGVAVLARNNREISQALANER